MKILVVEDNEVNRKVLAVALRRYGHEVVLANDGAEGIARFEAERFDLVLMDIQMPVMNGIDAITRIRSMATRRVPVIAVTALTADVDRANCLAAGADALLTKPVSLPELRRNIERLCRENTA